MLNNMEKPSERALRIVEEICRRTACDHYRLILNEERTPSITDSKIGGKPFWPIDKDYPVDEQGQPMLMVMQVNCSDTKLKAPLPEAGMLQWFISTDPEYMYGCRGNYDENGTGFRIIYHDTVDQNKLLDSVPSHDSVDNDLTPVKREVAIDVVEEQTVMNVSDGHFNRLFFEIVKEITGVDHSGKKWYEYLDRPSKVT